MWKSHLFIIFIFFCLTTVAQYPPPAGQEGSTAIHADSSVFIDWASSCEVSRGYMDISQPESGFATYGIDNFATEKADNIPVSLGDGGIAILTFGKSIINGPGPDFVVFENALTDDFLELAFVEVSSNGQDYVRFPSISLTQTFEQIETFGLLDATKLHNLAGKYRVMYGVPFDLSDLDNESKVDKYNITHVRIVSVTGSIDEAYADYDSEGSIINDPWPTLFESSGFDLDAVGVINNSSNGTLDLKNIEIVNIYPNPVENFLHFKFLTGEFHVSYFITDIQNHHILSGDFNKTTSSRIDIESLPAGLYLLFLEFKSAAVMHKFIKK